MDVEPCYPLLSAELESAKAQASSQQKIETLNSADYKVMRQLLPMTLVCHPTFLGSMVLNPDRTSDIICELEFAMDEEIEPDNLCPTKTRKVIEETFLRTIKQVWIWNTTGRTELYCALLFLVLV